MAENMKNTAEIATKEEPASTLTFLDGNTTVLVGVHFKKKSKETLDDKVRKLILSDVKAGNF